jgi:hypothetical protein
MKTVRTVKVTDGVLVREMEIVRFLGRVKLWDKSRDEFCDFLIDLPDETDHAVAGAIRGNGLEIVYEPEPVKESSFSRVCVLVYRMENMVLGASVLISAERTLAVQDAATLLAAVTRGVTKWMLSSAEGRKAWEYSGEDFNVGDLASWLGEEDLVDCLLRERVVGLTIEQLDNFNADWVYDTVLVNVAELEEVSDLPEPEVPVAGYWVMEGSPDLVKWGRDGDTVEPFLSREEAWDQARFLMGEDKNTRFYVLTVFENGQLLTEEVGF